MPTMDRLSAAALARDLELTPKYLRALIREHRLVPSHQHYERYELDADDVRRISEHPAVVAAQESR